MPSDITKFAAATSIESQPNQAGNTPVRSDATATAVSKTASDQEKQPHGKANADCRHDQQEEGGERADFPALVVDPVRVNAVGDGQVNQNHGRDQHPAQVVEVGQVWPRGGASRSESRLWLCDFFASELRSHSKPSVPPGSSSQRWRRDWAAGIGSREDSNAIGGWRGKNERGMAHPTLRRTLPQQDGEWRNEATTRGEERFTRCVDTALGSEAV
jgi:hypothetical protein